MEQVDSNKRRPRSRTIGQVIEEIINLVQDLKVVWTNINNGIEEIDLLVRNHNRKNIVVWARFVHPGSWPSCSTMPSRDMFSNSSASWNSDHNMARVYRHG
jgi:hypothetical protein